jgi:RNA polymerase sigma factor (sigma-70 family)
MDRNLHPVPAGTLGTEAPIEADTLTFEEFFTAENARLFGALSVMTGNRSEAEEVMQDAFLAVWERWDRVVSMESPVGFLYRTALNLHRKRARRAALALRKAVKLVPEDDALAVVEARDEATRVLRGLTRRERQAMVLTAYLGYSTEEAGRILGIRAATVRVLTARARATVKATSGGTR